MSNMILLFYIFGFFTTTRAQSDFLIDKPQCRIPNFSAFSEETSPIFTALPYQNCTDLNLLTYTSVENNTAYLHINKDFIDQYYSKQDSIDCCYSYVKRNGSVNYPDVGISFSPCEAFNSTIRLIIDTVRCTCYLGADKIYENVHSTVTVPEYIDDKMKNLTNKSSTKPLSVLIIVIDSVARLNFERTMPATKNFLLENNFTEFLGYNKIADNTFPNFNALITGLNLKQSNHICKPEIVGQLDTCPMVWYDFRRYGYATAYAEDWASISTYNYLKKGFKEPPTDYYFKPYMEAAQSLGTKSVDTMPFCAGPETQGERTLNVAKDFAFTFKNKPSFGIFWMNTFSHNYINSPTRMDATFKTFFEDLKTGGILNDSMVILLADHGIRFGEIRQTIQGWYEERLPMNFISLPSWFIEQNPTKYANLKMNSKKLTSTYDLYMTLQEVLSLSTEEYTVSKSLACPTCKSLFSEIPEKRSCSYAGIPEEWCTCIGKFDKNHPHLTPEVMKKAVKFILDSGVLKYPISINKINYSSITYHQRRAYFLIILEATDTFTYQVLLRATSRPLNFVKLIQIIKLWKMT